MKFYYDSGEEKLYTNFNDLCEALREAYEEYMQDEENKISLEEWVKGLIDNDITVYEAPDNEIVYFDPSYGRLYTDFYYLEEAAINWDDFYDYLDERYTASDIFNMTDTVKDDVKNDFIEDNWRWFFDDVGIIYKIDTQNKEVKECYCYDDLWD